MGASVTPGIWNASPPGWSIAMNHTDDSEPAAPVVIAKDHRRSPRELAQEREVPEKMIKPAGARGEERDLFEGAARQHVVDRFLGVGSLEIAVLDLRHVDEVSERLALGAVEVPDDRVGNEAQRARRVRPAVGADEERRALEGGFDRDPFRRDSVRENDGAGHDDARLRLV